MKFKYNGYSVEYSPYVNELVEAEEGVPKDTTVKDVLGYFLEKILEQRQPKEPETFTHNKFLGQPASELGVFIDPKKKKVFFGTEAEALTRFNRRNSWFSRW